MSLFNEDIQIFDEQQLIADNLARLRRSAAASQTDGPQVVYPSGYLPPEVERAKRDASYRQAVKVHREYSRKRIRQGRLNYSKGGYTPPSR